MTNDLKEKYFFRKRTTDDWDDVTELFDGLRVLKIDGYNKLGKPVNVYTAQWVNTQSEDYVIAGNDVIYENGEIEITFIISGRYAVNSISVEEVHDDFKEYMTKGDLYVKSKYTGKEVRCACLEGYAPTTEDYKRGVKSYVMGTIKLHCLDLPQSTEEPYVGDLYIGFNGSVISTPSQITSLERVQHYNKSDASGTYNITTQTLSYLWICVTGTIASVTSNGFTIPMNDYITVGDFKCYRSANNILANTQMEFTITT